MIDIATSPQTRAAEHPSHQLAAARVMADKLLSRPLSAIAWMIKTEREMSSRPTARLARCYRQERKVQKASAGKPFARGSG
jgi:hypothetical protein